MDHDDTKATPNRNRRYMAHPVDVVLHNCSIDIKNRSRSLPNKRILHSVSTTIKGGTLFAILGGSGSGKTTLLNVIAGRYSPKSFHIGGYIAFSSNYQCNIGYVTQNDFLLPYLTVRETLMFAARMKISPHQYCWDRRLRHGTRGGGGRSQTVARVDTTFSDGSVDVIERNSSISNGIEGEGEESSDGDRGGYVSAGGPARAGAGANANTNADLNTSADSNAGASTNTFDEYLLQRVNDVILNLGIRECADSMIGSSDPAAGGGKRGLSGGEKRRVSIAIQIISDPQGKSLGYSGKNRYFVKLLKIINFSCVLLRSGGNSGGGIL